MDETLKRRLVGIAVISLLVLIVAWWLPDRQDGQKRLNPETLPTETRVYDINRLGEEGPAEVSETSGTETDTAETGVEEAAPPPDIQADFGQALNEGATVAEAEAQSAEQASGSEPSQVEDIDPEPAAPKEPAIKPAPVTTAAADSKTQSKPEPEPEQETVASAEPPATAAEPASTAAPKAVAGGDWLVQVGSYSKQANAESMRKKLAAKGYRVAVNTAQVSGTSYHRVRVGPYSDKADANAAAANLKQLLGQNVAVMAND